jgi:hypothetical protein
MESEAVQNVFLVLFPEVNSEFIWPFPLPPGKLYLKFMWKLSRRVAESPSFSRNRCLKTSSKDGGIFDLRTAHTAENTPGAYGHPRAPFKTVQVLTSSPFFLQSEHKHGKKDRAKEADGEKARREGDE